MVLLITFSNTLSLGIIIFKRQITSSLKPILMAPSWILIIFNKMHGKSMSRHFRSIMKRVVYKISIKKNHCSSFYFQWDSCLYIILWFLTFIKSVFGICSSFHKILSFFLMAARDSPQTPIFDIGIMQCYPKAHCA